MTYDELEYNLGYPLRESDSSSTNWARYPQSLRRDAIRAAELRIALDLPVEKVASLRTKVSLSLDANYQVNLNSSSVLPHPLLKIIGFMDGDRGITIMPPDYKKRVNRFALRNRDPLAYHIEGNLYEFKYGNSVAYGDADPVIYYIRYPKSYEQFFPGYLLGGTAATTAMSSWVAVTSGSFSISIDGSSSNRTGINFSAATAMDDVASIIQTSLRAVATGGFTLSTCIWDDEAGRLVITSGTTSGITSVSVAGGGLAGTDVSGVGATAFMDCDSGGTGVSAVTGQAEFEWGTQEMELLGHEQSILNYATYYCLSQTQELESAKHYLEMYYEYIRSYDSAIVHDKARGR